MPDHVHLLVSVPATRPLSKLVGEWKSRCYQIRRKHGNLKSFWQRSYFDHGIRASEDLRTVAEYILQNPVRAGLVSDHHDYPLCGSFEFDL